MLIDRMRPDDCGKLLARLGTGRLATARNGQPYIVPIYFAHEPERLYGFATLGRKIEWMRLNILVCVQADEVRNRNDWESVIVNGRYEEITNAFSHAGQRVHAQSVLEKRYFFGGRPDTLHIRSAANPSRSRWFYTVFTSKR